MNCYTFCLLCHSLRGYRSQYIILLRQDHLSEVHDREIALFFFRHFEPDILFGLVPISDDVVTSIWGDKLIVSKSADELVDV